MIKLVDIDSIRPSAYNPRRSDKKRLEILAISLTKLGFVLPLFATVKGEILSGHQRHLVAKSLGFEQVPVVFTKDMPLNKRKAVNIAFNRGTNDLDVDQTPKSMTEALARANLDELVMKCPDAVDLYPCMSASHMNVKGLCEANIGRFVPYAYAMARMLGKMDISAPIVCRHDMTVVNGIGRLELSAKRKDKTIEVVKLDEDRANLSDVLLNLLSMDFDLEGRYEDLLRYNSFRRARRVRGELGRGFVFAIERAKGAGFDFENGSARWVRMFGATPVDFGAGHLHETDILSGKGVDVLPFEPYRVSGDNIDKPASIDIANKFLNRIESGYKPSSVFIASVLNSVPFAADRRHIVCIAAALCSINGARCYAVASSTNQSRYRGIKGAKFVSHDETATFMLDYEAGIQLGDFQDKPKVQKYHSSKEFYDLFKTAFDSVNVTECVNNVQAIAGNPNYTKQQLSDALTFEFDLPYPDGSRMGLVDRAIEVFEKVGLL